MRKMVTITVFLMILALGKVVSANAVPIEDGAEICTPKKGCKMLLNLLPTPISSVKSKKQCKVTWAVDPERPELFSSVEPLPKKGCKMYMSQNLGRWWRIKARPNAPHAVYLKPIPLKYATWR